MSLHEDEIEIDEPLIRALVDRTDPEFVDLSLRPMGASGSSNTLFRLGEHLLVRLPRQPGGSATIVKEARWLPYLATGLPVAVPEVVAVGEPGFGYPERWSIVRWIDGHTPGVGSATATSDGMARDLARVVRMLRTLPVPPAAFDDPQLRSYRGEPLAAMDGPTRRNLADCRGLLNLNIDVDACERVWDAAMQLPGISTATSPGWLHGDLLGENLLVRDGRLAAVLDFGALAVGDPTVDLIAAWDVLAPAQRAVFRAESGVDELTWLRGRAWALAIAAMTFPYYWHTMRARCAARVVMTRAILDDAAP